MTWRDFLRANQRAIVVFPYHQAPDELQLSSCGGDEDQVVVFRADNEGHVPYQLESLSCCSNDRVEVDGGEFVAIVGCHA